MSVIIDVCKMLADFFMFFIKGFFIVLIPFFLMLLFFFVFGLLKGKRIRARKIKLIKSHYTKHINFLKRIYIDFPRRIIEDLFTKDPDGFDTYGVHIFSGEQGSGKSIAAVHFMKMIKERNPGCKIASNVSLDFQDEDLRSWEDILQYNNGKLGQVIFLDEIQNWFSSNESKNFPPEMLTEITQQRKQRKIVVGTSQVFTRLSKPIREQITNLYLPITVMGCITFVRVYRLKLKDDGTVDSKRIQRIYFFVHDDELRNAYDTYEKVQRLSLVGFKEPQNDITRSGNIGFAPVKQNVS